jgi:NMT1-like family
VRNGRVELGLLAAREWKRLEEPRVLLLPDGRIGEREREHGRRLDLERTIIVSTAMSEGVAYTITKTINDNAERFRALHASLAEYDPSRGWSQLGVPLHPGAERYYREKGWLK